MTLLPVGQLATTLPISLGIRPFHFAQYCTVHNIRTRQDTSTLDVGGLPPVTVLLATPNSV